MRERVFAIAAAFAASLAPAFAAPAPVGAVDRVEADVTAAQTGETRPLSPSSPLLFKDSVRTGAGARFEGKLDDGTVLTLGEKGKLKIDEFVYKPGEPGGKLALTVAKGAFLFVGGKIEGPTGGNVEIRTQVGVIGVRGTTVWGGPIDGGFGVLCLKGEVWVKTKHGVVDLKEGKGTMLYAGRKPLSAAPWPDDRTKRAVATVSFR